jgi:hypothetical protein
VRTHVRDTGRLRGSPRGRSAGGRCRGLRRTTGDEAAPDLTRRVELAVCEGASALDRFTRPIVRRSLCLEQRKDAVGAVGCPSGYQPTIFFAERLR